MTTFSRLVDDITAELVRPDMTAAVASYANQTVREMHFRPGVNAPVLYDANRIEDILNVTTEGTWLWSIPFATRFQQVEAIFHDQFGVYIEPRNPRIALKEDWSPYANLFYYRSGPALALSGVGVGQTAKISYFIYPPSLAYKPTTGPGARKIRFDPDTESYQLITGGTPTEADLAVETHWMLERWADTVKQGVRAKIWGRLAEMERSRLAFSAFESARTAVWNSEPSS